jgi:tetratricopeptide (TPR) repeat protein
LREAYRLVPGPNYLVVLADVFQRKGDHAGALALINKAKAMSSRSLADTYYSEAWFAKLEALARLEGRIPAILKGDDHPKGFAERLDLALMCYNKKLHAAAARFWAEALDENPKLGDDRRAQHRYNAACSAALAVGDKGKDRPTLDAAVGTDLRRRAFRWLEAELADWSKYLESDQPKKRETVVRIMRHWQTDADLAAVRDPHALTKILEAERKDWLALWDKVDARMRKAGEPKPQ